ncbi:uncharacterized protein LOC116294264 [Actinia tenebrosa]|uniref:Uncharacterized protein LOC116294264 n=1 Tax=Actinia tenebrosa TaxID=6105 RepID=A0A6P8HMU0_ACTTE|nr:uncharacterized protein LOC116294264 [Actinia tenebrosa]
MDKEPNEQKRFMNMKSIFVVLACLVSSSLACYQQGTCHDWSKLNNEPVCFEGRNNKPGIFKPSFEGFVAAVKLVHRSGNIVCGQLAGSHTSNWGCHAWPHLVNSPLNILVTNEHNDVIFPKAGATFTRGVHKNGKWYSVQGFDSRSESLVLLHSFNAPYYLGPKSHLKIWYGEDLLNYYEGDNVGRVCVDVYGYFA